MSQDQATINVLKGLVIDGVHKAKSGHPGGAMSSMDFAYLLFTEFLNFDPDHADWLGRDRFVLSAGHESMLIYSVLHMIGWLPLAELKRFRQLHSKTPGHPENILTKGVECTTGPLGQGLAMSVGMAIAATHHASTLDSQLFSQRIWSLCGDGCLQEDVALGAASLAGHLKLGNLTWYYDRNHQQISGNINRASSDDFEKIFTGFGWKVLHIDGHDHSALRSAMTTATRTTDRPLLIIGESKMAKGAATLEGSHKTHGEPLPDDERLKTKELLGLPKDQDFYVSDETRKHFQRRFPSLKTAATQWRDALAKRRNEDQAFDRLFNQCFEKNTYEHLTRMTWAADKPNATRNAFGDVLEKWASELPHLMGGSADLEPSNKTGAFAKKVGDFTAENRKGRNLHFGVREFPMSAITNGMALHGGILPFDATFLTFSDYSRPALRLGAIQKIRVLHVFTHDSFYLGEDGPTHQPIEHVAALRLIPDFYVMRPADSYETEVMMRKSLSLPTPSALCLSRQNLPILPVPRDVVEQAAKGAYIVREGSDHPDLIIIATGSEVSLALKVADKLGSKTRVVSMPCQELFREQPKEWREKVLPPACKRRIAIEAGSTMGWQAFVGADGLIIGIDHYGASAPMEALAEEFGFTVEKVLQRVESHRFA